MKLGEVLDYGLREELKNVNRVKDGDMLFLKSGIITMYFENLLDSNDVKKMRDLFNNYKGGVNTDFVLEETMTIIVDALKNKIQFDDCEQMISALNNVEMKYPWVLSLCNNLFELIPEVVILGDKVFFMQRNTNSAQFCYMNLDDIKTEILRWYELKTSEYVVEVSSNYNYKQMYGYNLKNRVIYLALADLDDVYVEYYIDTQQEKIIHNKCLGMVEEGLIIEKDGYLAYKKGEDIRLIKKAEYKLENYSIDNNHIYVAPITQTSVLKPYWLSINGIAIPT